MKIFKTLTSLAVAALACVSALGQDIAPIIAAFSDIGPTFPGSTTSNFTTSVPLYAGELVTLKAHNGAVISATVSSGATAVSPIGFKFDLSANNIDWTTTMPITNAVTLNGTNVVKGYTLFPDQVLDHMRYIRLSQIVNANTNVVNITNLRLTYFNKPR